MKTTIFFLFIIFSSFAFSQTVTPTKDYGYTKTRVCDTTLAATYYKTLTVGSGTSVVSAIWDVFSPPSSGDTLFVGFDGDTTNVMIVTSDIVYRPFSRRANRLHIRGTSALNAHIEVEK